MTTKLLKRYLLGEVGGSGRMNVLLDRTDLTTQHYVTLDGVDGEWLVLQAHETVRAESIKSNRTWEQPKR